MPQDLIRYDLLVQDALKGVVRKVLNDAASQGMPGEHHFYISFRTHDAGVRISQRLRDKYPDEMTIVLQHQFWDLAVTEHAFEVGLSFSGIPERLLIPFDSLTGFFDPSVQFGLKFELSTTEPADNDEGGGEDGDDEAGVPATLSTAPVSLATPARKPAEVAAARKTADRGTAEGLGDGKPFEAKPLAKPKAEGLKSEGKPAGEPARPKGKADAEKSGSGKDKDAGAEVVSLDSFRKKP
jgi:hypothetical protein